MKKKNIGVAAAAIAIIGGAAWYLHSAGEPPTKAAAAKGAGQAPTVVNVVRPQRQDVPVVLAANGTVTPVSTVDLHPQTTSTIRTVHIKEGQFVKKGDLMFSLDDRSDAANVDKARAQIARDQAALADAERQFKRSQELVAQKFLSQSAADTQRAQVEAARALVVADQAALRSTGVSASYNAIRAPMSGRVGAINVYPGSLVQLATSLTTITQLDPITVAFTLPETALADVLAAQKRGKVEVQASSGDAGKPVTGALSFVDNAVDAVSGTIRVKAQFDNRDNSLWPGQYVNARLTVQTLAGALVIPQAAIITSTRGTFVYVVDADLSARQVPVVRLHGFGLSAAVSGLTGDERVITEGKQNLRPGAKVALAGAKKDDSTRLAKKDPSA
ncbi:efflux RND transporter periplasmic adaptor subunit [Massilia sp. R2A-15]|uniref:efflux RND transporter periplasmic adaptor subunit n=1 Tax=Massilia sp. R2A-15 TaxID=3064278 RepID=UPI0027332ACF|nr:efflux RND transporter periplasmic adaptor subunit [Massilia sp. R2A-15]WLI89437.1 efflux RND transporter periplasmic adaptor subunit [Massilia sp. R2A-15]